MRSVESAVAACATSSSACSNASSPISTGTPELATMKPSSSSPARIGMPIISQRPSSATSDAGRSSGPPACSRNGS